ncbi:unnamed protein product [Parascedosporium putredinis]|uniref:Uncharacterized protein n=1 Tax=Parascedosporium putredinis TaxID=1442378 RepID=A0A9P1MDH3_9PEZI|nr:unnamed protein product [Parascedosporium putredinis]CAI8002559.1 unnamed protein product [Parascedosporium putredinis]
MSRDLKTKLAELYSENAVAKILRTATVLLENNSHGAELATIRDSLEALGRTWSDPLHGQARRHDIHDLGFMIQPHMRARWELYHDTEAFETVKVAAESLLGDSTLPLARSARGTTSTGLRA